MRPLYISATEQNSGKTTFICGLYQILRKKHLDAGYFKPVGQRYVRYKDQNVDKYYDEALPGNYNIRYNLFILVVTFTGLIAIVVPFVLR